jgi:hypothetical protein
MENKLEPKAMFESIDEIKLTAKQQMEALTEKFEEMRKEFMQESQDKMKLVFKEFFDASPGVKSIVWTQYTPYFNDGDTCEFSVNTPTFSNSESGEDVSGWGEYEGDDESIWATGGLQWVMTSTSDYLQGTKAKILAGEKIDFELAEYLSTMLQSSSMEDVMQGMFGNHVKIVATINGFDIEEYDHD